MEKKERMHHYQLEGTTNKWMQNNSKKLNKVFTNHSTDFDSSSDVYNTITKAVFANEACRRVLTA